MPAAVIRLRAIREAMVRLIPTHPVPPVPFRSRDRVRGQRPDDAQTKIVAHTLSASADGAANMMLISSDYMPPHFPVAPGSGRCASRPAARQDRDAHGPPSRRHLFTIPSSDGRGAIWSLMPSYDMPRAFFRSLGAGREAIEVVIPKARVPPASIAPPGARGRAVRLLMPRGSLPGHTIFHCARSSTGPEHMTSDHGVEGSNPSGRANCNPPRVTKTKKAKKAKGTKS